MQFDVSVLKLHQQNPGMSRRETENDVKRVADEKDPGKTIGEETKR